MLAMENSTSARVAPTERDVGSFMGRSFRVGWAPNGKLIRPSSVLGNVVVSKVSASSTAGVPSSAPVNTGVSISRYHHSFFPPLMIYFDFAKYILELLQTHLSHSSIRDSHFVVADVNANIQANIKTSNAAHYDTDLYKRLWTLVYALWGKLTDSSLPPSPSRSSLPDANGADSSDRAMSVHMLRKLLVGKWLSQTLLDPIENDVKV